MSISNLPIAIIGGGPIGLAAAAHLARNGRPFLVFEAGPSAGWSVTRWGHVGMFSPWRYNLDPAAVELLAASGWQTPPGDRLPTGRELVDEYLAPLSRLPAIAPHLRLNSPVRAVGRLGLDKLKTAGRADAPFVVHVANGASRGTSVMAGAVIDASGTYACPNPLGADGLPALGEADLAERIFYGIPDVLGQERQRYAGRRVLVVGSGHSALNALAELAELAEQSPGTSVVWAVRRTSTDQLFGGETADQLPARGALGTQARALVERGAIELVTDFRVAALDREPGGVVATSDSGARLREVDEIIAATGLRPDFSALRELRLELDPAVESPRALATLIDPELHSCGTVPPHGSEQLRHPEPGLYVVGMKSYGRAPTFLLMTGYEQVRSVVCALSGDLEGARAVRLELPETGVCSAVPLAEPAGALSLLAGGEVEACCPAPSRA